MQTAPPFRFSVAPMMDWTDRHCRLFHRQLTRRALLYTEMVTAAALVRGGAWHLLDHAPAEHPLALQLGGSDPGELAEAAAGAAPLGFAEINLNVGCPSDRVQSGAFGAVLMERPGLVAACVAAMARAAPGTPITVKCRIGIDDQDPAVALPRFLDTVATAGVRRFVIHARKAWLQGLSPRENREIPPLDHPLVLAMKARFPALDVVLNGGIASLTEAQAWLGRGLDGVMLGRAAYRDPWAVLAPADAAVFGGPAGPPDQATAARAMIPHIAAHVAAGGRAHDVARHMLGLYAGQPGARAWRHMLSTAAARPCATSGIIDEALAAVADARNRAA
jgi:tRNA-dihydrouridine synthase A